MRVLFILTVLFLPMRAFACELALVLAVDVSGSVDVDEYQIQMEGLAGALRDGIVIDALVDQQAHISLIQWSGSSRQEQVVPWTAIRNATDVVDLAAVIAHSPRKWRNYSTAIGEAVGLAIASFDEVPQCRRKVIDVSGDGESNEGISPQAHGPKLRELSIVVNALAIETEDTDLTAYFYEHLIAGDGAFVITANGFEDYPEQIKRKLQRETIKQLSRVAPRPKKVITAGFRVITNAK